MNSKYVYKGMNITLDVYEKIRAVAEALAAADGTGFDESFRSFACSDTYRALSEPGTLMWSESVPFIVDEYRREIARP